MANKNPIEYSDSGDDAPCIVAKKPCGCYVAACCLDGNIFEEISDLFRGLPIDDDDDDYFSLDLADLSKSSLLELVIQSKKNGATLEVRPVAFVRQGGLAFDCEHLTKETAEVGQGPVTA